MGLLREDLIGQIIKLAKFVKVTTKIEVITEHPADNKFIECAQAAEVDYVVSGDKHVLNVGTYRQIKVLSVTEFVELLRSNGC